MSKAIPRLRFKEFNDSWNNVLLEDIAIRGSGHTPNKSSPSYYNGNIKWISLADSKKLDNGYINETEIKISKEGIENSSAVLHPKGSVLLSRDAGIGKSAVMKSEMAVSQHFIVWQAKESVLSNWFLYYKLQILKPEFERIAIGSTIKTIGLPYFKKLKLRIPNYKEQQKIASFLSAVDEKIQQLTRKKELLEQYKKGVMQQLFSSSELGFVGLEDDRISDEGLGVDRIDAYDKNNPTILKSKKSKFRQLRFKDENGKAYPKWEEKRLGEVCESIKSGRDKASEEGSFPLYGSTGKIGNSNEYSHDGNYILIARVGANAGTINLIDGKFAVSDNTLVVSCYDKKSIKYVFYYLNFFNLNKLIFGSGQPLITGGQLKDLQLPFPSKEEQQKIANFLSAIDAKIKSVATQIEKTQTFKKGLLQQMFV